MVKMRNLDGETVETGEEVIDKTDAPVEEETESVVNETPVEKTKQKESVMLKKTMEAYEVVRAKPKPIEPKTKAIYDLEELTNEEKETLVRKRIEKILSTQVTPMLPTLVTYKEGNTPVKALVTIDCRLMEQAWDFYKTNVHAPTSGKFVDMVVNITNAQKKTFRKVVALNLL